MELEFHQLELRYDRLRIARPDHERRLLSSLAEVGQQVPIVVVKDGGDEHFVVIDGYKRVRALRRLGRDTVGSFCWECSEAEALVVSRLWHTGESETALEQSWRLVELHERFQLSQEELARRFTRSVSWVSRRLALVRELPESIQERVRRGEIVAHTAEKYLVPLARPTSKPVSGWSFELPCWHCFQRADIAFNLISNLICGDFQVIARLEIHPERRTIVEVARETQGCVSSNCAFLVDDIGDPRHRDAQVHSNSVHT
jgi:ParB/RepB/Spo0J family partition protein